MATGTDFLAVWVSFIEYLVRKCKWDDDEKVAELREAFTRATNHLHQSKACFQLSHSSMNKCLTSKYYLDYETEGDPECTLLQFWAYIEANKLNNMTKARELWGQIISQGHSKSAQWWLAFIQFER